MRNPKLFLTALALLVVGLLANHFLQRAPAPRFAPDLGTQQVDAPAASADAQGDGLPAFLPAEARQTIALIQRGGPFPHRQDGTVFGNREQRLPQRPRGYYHEYTVRTPGASNRGARRIITGDTPVKAWYYTSDHYETFRSFTVPAALRAPMENDELGLGLHDINNAGVYAIGNGDAAPLAAAMRAAGLRVARIDLQGVADKRTLLARLAAQLDFPNGFGGNWDALSDNLRDLQWLPATGGHALFLDDADALRAQAPKEFDTLLEVLDEACQYWLEQDLPFWAFIAHES